jgi:CCR4-NOT transcription complex subunit 7/8
MNIKTCVKNNSIIKEVYLDNFIEELNKISKLIERYKYIAMDTEFPGILHQPTNNSREANYKSIKKNVDSLKLIQVGITICDEYGNYPVNSTWQFNLKFDINSDLSSPESIALLSHCGISFEQLPSRGIPAEMFGEYLITSGLILNEELHWVSFHGVYDFAYLLRVITNLNIPENENGFFEILKMYFPHYYDIRYLVRYLENMRGSLSKLGQDLNCNRIGIQHQAGSDSLITSEIFFKLKNNIISDDIIINDKNVLFGIGVGDENEFYMQSNMYGRRMHYGYNMFPVMKKKIEY